MKNIISTFLLVLGMSTIQAQQEVVVGSGTTGSSRQFQRAAQAASEILYNGSEIGMTGTITRIGWDIKSQPFNGQINASIYMKMSTQSELGSPTSLNDYTLVYSGIVNCSTIGWQNILLTTPFAYNDSTKNLLFLITSTASDNTYSSSPRFSGGTSYRKQTNYLQTNPNLPWKETTYMNQTGSRSNIKLYFENTLSTVDITKNTTLKYYPNPVKNKLNISNSQNITSLELYNVTGQKIISAQPNTTETAWDLSKLQPGEYIIKVKDKNNSLQNIKIIKE
ncbi:hypothetical protein C1637_10470 [Chryseobacterium lactis]|uniref:T9SS C-terminal target domain-containing protein n=1 Tax=Chryseobacterium lactis TaxID=1241981 RepID=A0A3G6REV9_CHRLC|nr:T9SS type A sorting domain-containing protein [Chryseobacterium lactis]AZA82073.1 T9SS C-terminal target domain-containing protein [Chryseobacterium lactis]AZB02453.1 T9SS C-terminal target domain-containing protein [Chryseobacterium lactis]PNW14251.1 hypothetical protein C1637_10470 [Chryseobacterium lactis]